MYLRSQKRKKEKYTYITQKEGNISEYKNEISMKLLWEILYQLAICTTPRSTLKCSWIIYVFTKLHVSSLLDIFIHFTETEKLLPLSWIRHLNCTQNNTSYMRIAKIDFVTSKYGWRYDLTRRIVKLTL